MMKSWRFLASLTIVLVALATVVTAQTGRPGGRPGTTATTATTASTSKSTTPTPSATPVPTATGTTGTSGTNVQSTLEEILEEPQGAETYRYDPQGRRDPFRSLVGPAPKIEPGQRPPGVPGFLIDEIKLTGIIRTPKQGVVGVVSGPDNKGYLIRVGDKVLDGEVIRITPSSVVFRQEVNDPTRIERYREVVKDLTPPSEQKR